MGILLILAQVAFLVLHYGAHYFRHVSPWALWLPAILFGALWLVAILTRTQFNMDSFKHMFVSR